jgi:RHS repeat-associated protein
MNILVSQEVNESGLVYQQFTAPFSGTYFVTVTQNTVVNPASFYLDNYYVYALPASGQDFVSLYLPDVLAYNDYYPFGMQVPNRFGSIEDYRYGFNGMEKDDEIKGEGNSYDFGARMYDSRLGRFFSTDILERKYSMLSPYAGFANSPIFFVDKDGNENIIYIVNVPDEKGKKTISDKEIQKRIDKANSILSKKAEKGGYELKTKFVLFNPDISKYPPSTIRGEFDRNFIDKNDGVILMGQAEDIKRYDRENGVTGMSGSYYTESGEKGWIPVRYSENGVAFNPENTVGGERRGGHIDTETTNFDKQVLLLLHSAGHMTKGPIRWDDHINNKENIPNIMMDGNTEGAWRRQDEENTYNLLWDSKQSGNSHWKRRMIENFGNNEPKDNYDKNKQNKNSQRGNRQGPLKEDGSF